MNLEEVGAEIHRLSRLLDAGLEFYRENVADRAEKERRYRRGRAEAWVRNTDGTAAFREAQVDAATADLRYERDVAEGMGRAAYESIRARASQISALQTLVNAHRAEAEFVRTAP